MCPQQTIEKGIGRKRWRDTVRHRPAQQPRKVERERERDSE
jgi:hypothetical protein